MTLSELLGAVRARYIEMLANAAAESEAHIEPAFRRADGSLATEGPLDLPCRADIIPTVGPSAGQSVQVHSGSQLQFEPLAFRLGETSVSVHPFVWDWAAVEVGGLGEEAATTAFKSWFLEWFDIEDQNDQTEDALFGVVHFMSDPAQTTQGWVVTVDLGSSPARALEDLLFRMSDAGASQVCVGSQGLPSGG